MKMVAAAKLRRAQENLLKARPYAYRFRDLIDSLAQRAEPDAHPLLRQRQEAKGRVVLIVLTSDRGLCGAYNTNIVNAAIRATKDDFADTDTAMTVVGKKGVELLRRKTDAVQETHTGVLDGSTLTAAREIIDPILQDFAAGRSDAVYALYNEFKSAISQNVRLERLLPFEDGRTGASHSVDYDYEPSGAAVFDAIFNRYLNTQMHRIILEAAASEFGARMTAMDSATTNASEMIEKLTLLFNRVRQDAITTELIEVISGSEAL